VSSFNTDTLHEQALLFRSFPIGELSEIQVYNRAKLSAATRMKLLILVLFIAGTTIAVAGLYWYRVRHALEQARARGAWLTKDLERIDSRIEVVEIWV
jgi:Tfp pilus assembly protein PilN